MKKAEMQMEATNKKRKAALGLENFGLADNYLRDMNEIRDEVVNGNTEEIEEHLTEPEVRPFLVH